MKNLLIILISIFFSSFSFGQTPISQGDLSKHNIYADSINTKVIEAGCVKYGLLTVTATGAIPDNIEKIYLNNGATAITLTLPNPALRRCRAISFSRMVGSTGTITIQASGGSTIQALNGTMGATTTIGAHSGTGGGVDIQFYSNGTNWLR